LVRWVNLQNSVHPLLLIGVFIVCFLAIHPFQDGNGRLSRILTTLLLFRFGYKYVPFASLESVIEENKELYYKSLRRTQKTLQTSETDWESWLIFFLKCLKKQKDNLSKKLERERMIAKELPKLSSEILQFLRQHEKLSISQIETLTNANRNTLKVRLRELVKAGHIIQSGKARAVEYTLSI
jgi:Fic family protein